MQVFGLAFVWFAGLAWLRPLALPDEGRYVGVAWEMLHSGNWVTPTLDGLPFFHKPPLFYWLTAGALDLFGPTAWAARSASILAGSTTIAILYTCVQEWLGERTARRAALVLATQPLFFGASQFANLDLLVAACISSCILLGARAALHFEADRPYRNELAAAYTAAGFGLLAKGLIGGVIPLLVLLAWLGLVRHGRTIRALFWWPGLMIVAVMVLPWITAAQWAHPGFLHYFFVVQHFQRFAGSGFNNVQPIWFYVAVLALLTLPWSAWLLADLRKPRLAQSSRPAVLSLMWVWAGVVLVFFSIPQSKLVGYILPALAPLAVLVAATVAPILQRSPRARQLWRTSVGLAVCTCAGATIAVAIAHPKSSRELAVQLSAQRAPHEGLAFVDHYAYDLPFYLRDTAPAVVVSNWDPAEIRQHDNWRKELADAGEFAPALAGDRLIGDERFRTLLCGGAVKWVVASDDAARRYRFLSAAPIVAAEGKRALWHTDVSDPHFKAALGCANAPTPVAR